MGGYLFGKSTPNIATNLRISSSLQGTPKAIGWGQNRLAPRLIWYYWEGNQGGNKGGKGGGGGSSGKGGSNSGEPDYYASLLYSVADGPLANNGPEGGFLTIFNGQSIGFIVEPPPAVVTAYEAIGVTIYADDPFLQDNGGKKGGNGPASGGVFSTLGDYAQTPWSYLVALGKAGQDLAYRGEALYGIQNCQLGPSPAAPNITVEVIWAINSTVPSFGPDVSAAEAVVDFISNPDKGIAGFPGALLDTLSDFKNYCIAAGLLVSPVLDSQQPAQSFLNDLMVAHASEFRWSDGVLTVRPYLDIAVTGNGVTYTPDTTPVYNFTVDHFLPNQGSLGSGSTSEKAAIAVARKNPADVINKVQVEYLDRYFLYNPVTLYDTNDALIAQIGGKLRLSDLRAHHFFCMASCARTSVAMQLSREQILNTYQFTVGAQFIRADVLDIVTITHPQLGYSGLPVRVTEIQENEDRSLTFTAEDVLGTLAANSYNTQPTLGAAGNYLFTPPVVNVPLIWEPPAALIAAAGNAPNPTGATPQIWLGASGATNPQDWGGCYVWMSLDGSSYENVGAITSSARQGNLTGGLASYSGVNPDNAHTLGVNIGDSGELNSTTAAQAALGATLCLVDQELLAYTTATFVSTGVYNLTALYRGMFGSTAGVNGQGSGGLGHANNAAFCLLDNSLLKLSLPIGLVGQTVYFKFQSFNTVGASPLPLSGLTAYPYEILGSALAYGVVTGLLAGGSSTDFGLLSAPVALTEDFGEVTDPYALTVDFGVIGS